MKVLVACEYSGRVRNAFTRRGHYAMSCDMLPTDSPGDHYVGDVMDVLGWGWDLMIAFPPCTYLTSSNAWRWDEISVERAKALAFVAVLMDEGDIPRVAIENPMGAIGTQIRPADQYVQPWWFGDPYIKRTGLWLKNLPKLVPEESVRPVDAIPWVDSGNNRGRHTGNRRYTLVRGTGERDPHARSLSFLGIARAMAEQWG